MRLIKYPSKEQWTELLKRPALNTENLFDTVRSIINKVKTEGDKAVLEYEATFDKVTLSALAVTPEEIQVAGTLVSDELKAAISLAKQNIETFHASQRSLQKTYVNALIGMLDKPKNSSGSLGSLGGYSLVAFDFPSEAPTIARGQLTDLRRDLTNAANASSGIYRSHYLNLKALIDAAFDVK